MDENETFLVFPKKMRITSLMGQQTSIGQKVVFQLVIPFLVATIQYTFFQRRSCLSVTIPLARYEESPFILPTLLCIASKRYSIDPCWVDFFSILTHEGKYICIDLLMKGGWTRSMKPRRGEPCMRMITRLSALWILPSNLFLSRCTSGQESLCPGIWI